MRTISRSIALAALFALLLAPAMALAARSGSSFGGRGGFRSAPSMPRSYGGGYSRPSGGGNVIIMPGFGYGFSPFGYGGGGGMGLFGSVMMLGVLGFGAYMVVRAVRRSRAEGIYGAPDGYGEDEYVTPGRAYVYKVQIGLGRSARGLQDRLSRFAEGDTSSEAGLASLLQQTALELMREKASIRYAGVEAAGPMSMTNGETKMNAFALGERSRFQVERVRGADGKVRRADAAATRSDDALEYILVTLIMATRTPLTATKPITEREQVDALLGELGGVSPDALLGLEVIWTPADPDDALTESDVMTSYPELRSV